MGSRTREDWMKLVKECETSGKSVLSWCRQNKIPTSTFRYWKNRKQILSPEDFVELPVYGKIQLPEKAPVEALNLMYKDISIQVTKNSDKSLLLECLQVLQGLS